MIYAEKTVVLKTLLEDANVRPLIDKAMSTYPMYVPQNPTTYSIIPTREELNKKILDHYKYREIGLPTIGMFIDELEISLNEIMPYYYQLFKSEDIMNGISDPFGNVDIKETFEQETSGNSTGSSSGETKNNTETSATSNTNTEMETNSKHVNSKTPQGQLNISSSEIDSVNYADEVNWNAENSNSNGSTSDSGTADSTTTSTGESTTETSGTTKHTLTKVGNQGVNTYAHDMKELREIFMNIVQQIINDKRIAELFMLVYN